MQQKLLVKQAMVQPTQRLTFNMPDVDGLFPGFKQGDFAVIYGPQSIKSITAQLCIRAQLPSYLGGLDSNVIFIDAASSSSLSNLTQAAEQQRIDLKTVLQRITNLRTYTAYRLTSLIMEKLEEAIEASNAKLVIISDVVGPFLSDNVDDQEAKTVYSQILSSLSNIAKKHRIIIIATYLPHESNRRNSVLQEITTAKAGTAIRFTKTPYTSEVELEKHPSYMLGVVDLYPENTILADSPVTSGVLETGLIFGLKN